MLSFLFVLALVAHAKPAPRTIAPARVFIPDDADPCDFERFRADAFLNQWVREVSPNTATAAHCYHAPEKILPVLSGLMTEFDHGGLVQKGGAKIDPRAAALTGYRLDSLIVIEREGKKQIGMIFRQGVNGPTAGQVFAAR